MGSQWRAPKAAYRNMFFRDLYGQPLRFAPNSLHRLFKGAQNFQARQTRNYALRQKWCPHPGSLKTSSPRAYTCHRKLRNGFPWSNPACWFFLLVERISNGVPKQAGRSLCLRHHLRYTQKICLPTIPTSIPTWRDALESLLLLVVD